MWRILLNPYVLLVLLIVGVLAYNTWRYSQLRNRMSRLQPQQKLSLVMQLLRIIGLFFRRF